MTMPQSKLLLNQIEGLSTEAQSDLFPNTLVSKNTP